MGEEADAEIALYGLPPARPRSSRGARMTPTELRELAEATTRDEWVALPTLDGSLAVAIVIGDLATEIPVPVNDADALFIAAADPSTVIALVDRLEAAEALLARWCGAVSRHGAATGLSVDTRAFLGESQP